MAVRSTEKLKKDSRFDELLGDLISRRLRQKTRIDLEKTIAAVKRKINPKVHQVLPDESDPQHRNGDNEGG